MGAVANMRPDLFKAFVAYVPFVDVINTMLDASLPLTTRSTSSGATRRTKADFDYMKNYSPYGNVGAALSGHARARVAERQPGAVLGRREVGGQAAGQQDRQNPLLLKANMGAGHGGASGRYDTLRELAFTYAYMLWQMGVSEGS